MHSPLYKAGQRQSQEVMCGTSLVLVLALSVTQTEGRSSCSLAGSWVDSRARSFQALSSVWALEKPVLTQLSS